MITVCIESPLRGDIARNVRYADTCLLDALMRGEAPFLGHLIYPRVLDDSIPHHRSWGIDAHVAWLRRAERLVVYVDLGISSGMAAAMAVAREISLPIEHRTLGVGWERFMYQACPTPGFLVGAL